MPCNQHDGWGWNDNFKPFYYQKNDINYDDIESQLNERKMKTINKEYTAMLCALFNDLKNRNILEDVLKTASEDGRVNFQLFIDEHEKEDIERLKNYLLQFSKHERQMLIKILNNES
jgi:hypothetical protein